MHLHARPQPRPRDLRDRRRGRAVLAATCSSRARSGASTCPAATGRRSSRSIQALLDAYPDETTVYPGHMGLTTLGRERATNPFLAELARSEREAPGAARHVRRAARAGGARARRSRTPRARDARARAGYRRIETPTFEAHRAVRARRRRVDRHRPEGDVHVRGRRRALADAAPRGHRAGRAAPTSSTACTSSPQPVKLWYLSSRSSATSAPQAGRYRQFWQVGAEAIGSDDPAVDAECDRAARRRCSTSSACATCGCGSRSLGTPETRAAYRERAPGPPARARRPAVARRCARASTSTRCARSTPTTRARSEVMASAPLLLDRPRRRGRASTSTRCARCSTPPSVAYEVDPTLVRGLDYYTRTVFEFTSDALGAQSGRRRRRALRRAGRAARRPADARHGLGGRRRADPAGRRAAPAAREPPRRPVRRLGARRGAPTRFALVTEARRAGRCARRWSSPAAR